jgi:FkbM family methyltransferase
MELSNNEHLFETFDTKYGKVTLYKNEMYIGGTFKENRYWDEDTLLKLKPYINPNRNILEIGGHCGTSSLVYSSYLNQGKKVLVYEAQENMYKLLVRNIHQNNLDDKIVPHHLGVFCYNGLGAMNIYALDGGGGEISKRYNEEHEMGCNFGGLCLGQSGENMQMTTVDSMELDDIGFIHCDAQGSENFIFSEATKTIEKYRPFILYENQDFTGNYLFDRVVYSYSAYLENSKFNIKDYCMSKLNYTGYIDRFNNGHDTLLIP